MHKNQPVLQLLQGLGRGQEVEVMIRRGCVAKWLLFLNETSSKIIS